MTAVHLQILCRSQIKEVDGTSSRADRQHSVNKVQRPHACTSRRQSLSPNHCTATEHKASGVQFTIQISSI